MLNLNPKDWSLRAKLVATPAVALLLVFLISGWLIQGQLTTALDSNEEKRLDQLAEMLDFIIEDSKDSMRTTMQLTVVQQSLYDGFFSAQTEDFDFLKEFLRQTMVLADVDDVLVVDDEGEVMLRAASDVKGDRTEHSALLKPILEHASITDRATQLAGVITTDVVRKGSGYLLMTAGPVLDVETVVAAVVFVKRLDGGFLGKQKRLFDSTVELWFSSPDRLSASTLTGWNLPIRLTGGRGGFDLRVEGRPYRSHFIPVIEDQLYLGMSVNVTENALARTRVRSMLIGVMLASVGLLIVLIWINISRTVRSMQALVSYADSIAKGDLAIRVEDSGKDEMGRMARSFVSMIAALSGIAGKLGTATKGLVAQASRLSSATQALAKGSRRQNEQTDAAAAASTELAQTTQNVAQNASAATEASEQAADLAQQGRGTVEQTVTGMTRIADSVRRSSQLIEELGKNSDEIGEIVTVIEGIAEQTNLLALNAAIEAARAGEQGRGFAVVADEVRQLAKRTSEATTEISAKILKIQGGTQNAVQSMEVGRQEVDRGVGLADEAKQSMEGIVQASSRSMDMVRQIATAAEEQTAVTEEISTNMENISKVTQDAENSSNEISKAAEDLRRMAENLKDAAAWFKVEPRET